jgi:type I restriction enzyme S subunit
MKAGWEVRPLGEICGFQGGTQPPKSEFVDTLRPGYVRLLQIRDFKSDDKAVFVRDNGKVKKCAATDILIGRYGASVGQIHRGKAGAYNVALVKTIPNLKVLDRDYFYHFLTSDLFQVPLVEKKSRGAQDGFNQEDIAPFLVPLPPLEEQQRIVAILDEALEGLARARTHAEANLQDARELFESIKANALDYNGPDRKTVVLCDVAEVTSGLVDPREAAYADMPHIGAGNMITGSDELVGVMTAREEKLISGKYLFDETMVLYSKIRPYLRKAARPDFGGLCSADVYPVKPVNAGLDRDFLFHLLLGHDFTEYAIQGSDRAGMPKVNRNHMFAYSFDLPPLEEQQKIAKVIDAAHIECQQLAELANAKLQSLDALRQSLLQKAFAGELT